MSKWDESHTEPIHDTPAEKDVLIRAMEAAGYTLDTIESTDDHLRFFGEGGQTMTIRENIASLYDAERKENADRKKRKEKER